MLKKICYTLLLVLITKCTQTKEYELRSPSSFFPKNKTKVLIVGTFHFDYPGLDIYKTDDKDKVDVLKQPKKSEVSELVEYIKRFQPTKIAIEARESFNASEKLRKYKKGEFRDQRNEHYQLAMRIAMEVNHDTLYEINSYSIKRGLWKIDSLMYKRLFDEIDWEREDPLLTNVEEWLKYDDQLIQNIKLLDYFKYMNSKENHQYDYGMYLLGAFKTENNQGADHLSMWWYNRNLRIFRNIQGITESNDDRILVIMGNGHAAILRQLLECSPEYEFIEFSSL